MSTPKWNENEPWPVSRVAAVGGPWKVVAGIAEVGADGVRLAEGLDRPAVGGSRRGGAGRVRGGRSGDGCDHCERREGDEGGSGENAERAAPGAGG